jgi:hypothetical protein
MSLRKLYLLWLAAAAMSLGIGVLFFLAAMKITYGNFSGHEDFDGLVYTIESIILIIFSTGAISALFVLINKNISGVPQKHLAKRLLAFYSIFALFCIATFNFAFIYLNPLSLIIFAAIPKLAWDATIDQSQTKRKNLIFASLLIAILLLGGLEFLNIVLSDPFRK